MADAASGFPNWVDLGTSDLAGATAFYSALFGWTPEVSPDPAYGGYTIFTLGGEPVAGAGALLNDTQPVAWSSYFATSSADTAATRVAEAGGTILMEPFDVGDQGRMAVFLDPAGATFSVWEPGSMTGAELLDAPGALTWNELITRDVDGSVAFYGEVFGWTARAQPLHDVPYLVWERGGRMVGGLMPMVGDSWPADMSAHWMIYFAVEDCDATAARAFRLGGSVPASPTTTPMGRYAVINDPQGATFSILADLRR